MYQHHNSPSRSGWPAYDYTSPPGSPYSQSFYATPATASPRDTTKKGHYRKASYASPRESGWYSGYTRYQDRVPEYVSSRKFDNVPPSYEEDVKRSRARRASTATRPSPSKPPKMAAPPKSPTKATEADAKAAGIPPGYSIKNWDPDEAPIVLLGSVFDANSLGKWIYDWTVHHHGASTPMADVAGELWLLLIKLAGKVKRADEFLERNSNHPSYELLLDFLEGGERLWNRFKALLKDCELFMYRAAQQESGRSSRVSMGRNAGCEFVDSIFGRDRKLDETERLMSSIRTWDMRFDANCEAVLRPSRRSSRRQSTV